MSIEERLERLESRDIGHTGKESGLQSQVSIMNRSLTDLENKFSATVIKLETEKEFLINEIAALKNESEYHAKQIAFLLERAESMKSALRMMREEA